ncbi:MAG: hypothetical protein DHS20C02_07130 [Micavibrio sp.]|nr:MAG: hypothetical protein DHS20C02_07130 [Micavibrio sp.]
MNKDNFAYYTALISLLLALEGQATLPATHAAPILPSDKGFMPPDNNSQKTKKLRAEIVAVPGISKEFFACTLDRYEVTGFVIIGMDVKDLRKEQTKDGFRDKAHTLVNYAASAAQKAVRSRSSHQINEANTDQITKEISMQTSQTVKQRHGPVDDKSLKFLINTHLSDAKFNPTDCLPEIKASFGNNVYAMVPAFIGEN